MQSEDAIEAVPDVSVIIVSYNTVELTLACVDSVLSAQNGLVVEVVVVDNASIDGTADAVATRWPSVVVVANEANVGFARANNIGFRHAHGRNLLLLNPDCLLQPDTLSNTLQFLDDRPDAGLVGCRVFDPDGRQAASMFHTIRLRDVFVNILIPHHLMQRYPLLASARYAGRDPNQVHEVEVVTGCFMCVRKAVVEQVGGLDSDFFLFGEESEWCHRIRRAGWSVLYYPGARITHVGGASTEGIPATTLLAMAEGQLLLMEKVRGWPAAWLANAMMLLREIPRCLAWSVFKWIPVVNRSRAGQDLSLSIVRLPMFARGLFRREWRHAVHARHPRVLSSEQARGPASRLTNGNPSKANHGEQ